MLSNVFVSLNVIYKARKYVVCFLNNTKHGYIAKSEILHYRQCNATLRKESSRDETHEINKWHLNVTQIKFMLSSAIYQNIIVSYKSLRSNNRDLMSERKGFKLMQTCCNLIIKQLTWLELQQLKKLPIILTLISMKVPHRKDWCLLWYD